MIVFRTSQAYSRFWSALGDTHQMMAAWMEAASSLLAFSRSLLSLSKAHVVS